MNLTSHNGIMTQRRGPYSTLWTVGHELLVVSIFLVAAGLVMGQLFPTEGNSGSLYIMAVFMTLWLSQQYYTFIVALLCTALLSLESFVLPVDGSWWQSLNPELPTLSLIWLATLLVSWRRHSAQAQQQRTIWAFVEHSPGFVCCHDLTGHILAVNANTARALGYEPHTMIQRHLQQFLAPSAQPFFDAYLLRIRHHASACGHLRVLTQSGQERLWSYRTARVEEAGIPFYVVGYAQDITSRRHMVQRLRQATASLQRRVQEHTLELLNAQEQWRDENRQRTLAEQALQARTTHYLTLLQHSLQGVSINQHDKRVFTNRALAVMFGYDTPEAMVGQEVMDVVAPYERERLRGYTRALQQGDEAPMQYEYQALKQDGKPFWIRERVLRLRWNGEPAVLTMLLDITGHQSLVGHQSQKLEAIGTLAGGIAHDFNNILGIILGYGELALAELPQDSKVSRHLAEIRKAARRARDLIQQILTFSRQSEQERQPLQLSKLVQEALTLLRASFPATVEIRQELSSADTTVLADRTQMHQILVNLCVNAEYAMRENGGVLEVRVAPVEVDAILATQHRDLRPGPYVRLAIRDTGCGIPPEVVKRIFEPFYTTKENGEGTGMGLAVVHGIVSSHSGAITVQSTPGAGTIFTLYFPRINVPAIEETMSAESAIPSGEGNILFVDDEESAVRMGRTILENMGYNVFATTSSREALERFRLAPSLFSLVITDQTMPHMTGTALAKELRQIRADIPIVLCTGFSHTIDPSRAHELGLTAFLMKPWTSRELGTVIKRIITSADVPPPSQANEPEAGANS